MTESTPVQGNQIEPVLKSAIEKVGEKSISMADLLKVLQPVPVNPPVQHKVPAPAAITDEQRKALERLVEVFGKVVPTERRTLQPAEVTALLNEKSALAEIKKMTEKRTEGIRTTVFNHFDVEAEASEGFDLDEALRDKDGHYVLDGEVEGTPGSDQKFTRETRDGAPSLDLHLLEALAEDPEVDFITRKDFLSMTTQTRVVDEAKVMVALKKNPALVRAIAKASKPGSKTSSFNVRKA